MTTLNGGYTIWNWIELWWCWTIEETKAENYMIVESIESRARLLWNVLPVYSSNGWEMRQDNYNEKIRFIITLSQNIN
jgi:hypothetical protein